MATKTLRFQKLDQFENSWTMLPDNWEQLRRHWEYSQATSAVLNVLAVAALILSLLADKAHAPR